MSDLQIPKRTELEKRLADALANLLLASPSHGTTDFERAVIRAHQILRRYNAKTQAEMLS